MRNAKEVLFLIVFTVIYYIIMPPGTKALRGDIAIAPTTPDIPTDDHRQLLTDDLISPPSPAATPQPQDDEQTLDLFFQQYKHGPLVDKWNTYFNAYNKHFGPFRGKNFTFVELGVQSGGSILMWKHYFGPGMKYVGIDINPQTQEFHSPEYDVEIVIGDSESREFWSYFKQAHPVVEVFLDDGGHKMQQQKVTFEEMFDHIVHDGGVYACEDIHTSYISEWYLGNPQPSKAFSNDKQTFIDYTKSYIDWLHQQHWKDEELSNPVVSRSLVGIHFYQNMVFLDKGDTGTVDVQAGDYTLPVWSDSYDGKRFDWRALMSQWMKDWEVLRQ